VLTLLMALLPLGHSIRSSWNCRFGNHSYGTERFVSRFKPSKFWGLVVKTVLAAAISIAVVFAAAYMSFISIGGQAAVDYYVRTFLIAHFEVEHGLVLLALLIISAWPAAVWRATADQLLFAGIQLEAGVSFDTGVSVTKVFALYFVNIIAIVLSLGFAIPWAAIRVARYRASVCKVICYTNIEELVADKAVGVMQLKQATTSADDVKRNVEMHSALDQGELDLPTAA